MKYIVLATTNNGLTREFPIIFPNELVHSMVAEQLLPLVKGAAAVSAGEISSMGIESTCHGGSDTLKLKSRGKLDDLLIRMRDYNAGIV